MQFKDELTNCAAEGAVQFYPGEIIEDFLYKLTLSYKSRFIDRNLFIVLQSIS